MFEVKQNSYNEKFEFLKSIFPNAKVKGESEIFEFFENPRAEYDALTLGVALKDLSNSCVFEITGDGSLDFLNRVTTNSIKDLKPFESRWTLFTNEKGRIIDRTLVINFKEKVLLVGSAELKNKLYSWINKYITLEDLKLNDISSMNSVLELSGPQADSFMTLIFDNEIENRENDQIGNFKLNELSYWIIKKTDFSVKKYFIICTPENGINLIKYMLDNKSVFDFKIVGDEAYNIFRIERGIPAVSNEINDFNNPLEIGLSSDVSFTKGCYIGQEVIARLDTYDKVQRSLKGITSDTDKGLTDNASIIYESKEIGKITSSVYSPNLKKNIALGLIKNEFNKNGLSVFTKDEAGTLCKINIVDLPFKK